MQTHSVINSKEKGGHMESLSRLDAIFRPKSVAVIGASPSAGKLGYDIVYNMIHAGFAGPIYPVNPKADQILNLPVYKQIGDISPPPELAVIIIPARAVPGAIDQCGLAGVSAAVVITGGFAEAGEEGEKLQEELAITARRYGIRVIGPNCQGVNNPHHNLCASWPLLTRNGRMAFISQSGTVGAALMDWASQEFLGVSVFVSLGNRADVCESECIEYFNNDPNTKVIALYMEGVKRPAHFLEALSKASKPVVILKSGRTERGKVAAESHTKSMAGSDEIYNAIFKKYRIYRANDLEELYDYSKALAYMEKPPGKRLLHISSSGGAAILAIDEADKLGFLSPAPSQQLVDRLRVFLPSHCGTTNPIDLTGDAISDPGLYAKTIHAARGEFDTGVIIFGDPIHGASDIVTGKDELIIFCGGADVEREESKLIHQKGIPVFPTPERGIRALAQLFRFDEPVMKEPVKSHAERTLKLVSPGNAVDLLKKYRIPAIDAPLATSVAEALRIARKLGFPVAMKIASPDVSHKSDVGGVRLNIATESAVRKSYREIINSVKKNVRRADIEGITVSPMAKPGGLEVIVGVVTDPQYGPTLMFGLGGIFTEIYRDVQFCLLPASEKELRQMIQGITGYPLLAGSRGQTPKDRKALVEIMKRVARMALDNPDVDQIDLNPVLVYDRGAIVVDVRIYRHST
jgi:acetyltransferase